MPRRSSWSRWLGIIFAEIVPGVDATPGDITVGVAVLVALNMVVSLWAVRRGRAKLEWTIRAFVDAWHDRPALDAAGRVSPAAGG